MKMVPNFLKLFVFIFLLHPVGEVCANSTAYKKIFFFGESCIGKSTLIRQVCLVSPHFYMPILTMTRAPRADDIVQEVQYTSKEEFALSKQKGEFFFVMDAGENHYGYKKVHVSDCNKHALIYGSPFFIDEAKGLENSLLVLIEGNREAGFLSRQDGESVQKARRESNRQLYEKFFSKADFRQKMHLIFFNQFGSIISSAEQLLEGLNELIAQ